MGTGGYGTYTVSRTLSNGMSETTLWGSSRWRLDALADLDANHWAYNEESGRSVRGAMMPNKHAKTSIAFEGLGIHHPFEQLLFCVYRAEVALQFTGLLVIRP